jgi:hypothetical protein
MYVCVAVENSVDVFISTSVVSMITSHFDAPSQGPIADVPMEFFIADVQGSHGNGCRVSWWTMVSTIV